MSGFPCDHCDLPPGTCRNELRNSPNGCELARTDPAYREHFRRLSLGLEPASAPIVLPAASSPALPPVLLADLPPCVHRSIARSCCSEFVVCALGDGSGPGVVEPRECVGCPDVKPPAHDPFVAPKGSGGWVGGMARKPWDYRVTATLACLDSPDIVGLAVDLLRLQTERPYLIVVDTGSSAENLDRLEALRGDDLEIHHIRAGAYQHSSDPVALACDLAQARCQTDYLYFTHADCFTRRRGWLADLLWLCDSSTPVVGYQLTDRSHATESWRGMFGHTALMTHVPTVRKANAWWSYQWMLDMGDRPGSEEYWDTEVGFFWSLKRAGITPKLIGSERNYARNVDDNIDHVRSYASRQIYGDGIGTDDYRANVERWFADAAREARERIARWRADDLVVNLSAR